MENPDKLKDRYGYRVRYARGADVRFVSHLDMLKLFDRAARRAGLPVAYSSGFNPHPLFVFGMPLPVGVTSEDESVDISFTEELQEEAVRDRLNRAMPPAVRILGVKRLPPNADNIMKSVVASRYRVTVRIPGQPACGAADAFSRLEAVLRAGKALPVLKRTKSGERETDIMPMIYSLLPEQEAENAEKAENGDPCVFSVLITTAAGNITNLRPELALSALAEKAGVPLEVLRIHRLRLLEKADLKDGTPV